MRRPLKWLALCVLSLAALVACDRRPALESASIDGELRNDRGRAITRDQAIHVEVAVTAEDGRPLVGLLVTGDVFDARGQEIGSYRCDEAAVSGSYRSESFVPNDAAVAGEWTVHLTATRGDQRLTKSVSQSVAESLRVRAQQALGLNVDVPTHWELIAEQAGDFDGRVVFDAAPGSEEFARLELRYAAGKSGFDEETVSELVANYTPVDGMAGRGYVRQTASVSLGELEGIVGRGEFVKDSALSEHYAIQAFRFYCADVDETITTIVVSTSDGLASEVSAVLDSFGCPD